MQLLTVGNPKTAKGEKRGYLTAILHLAPHKLSGHNMCPWASKECVAGCLNTAGRGDPRMVNRDGIQTIARARLNRTNFLIADEFGFMVQLVDEIASKERLAIRHGLKLAVRLDGTSDRRWETRKVGAFANIMAVLPNVIFYDYTKAPLAKRAAVATIPNYSITFSYSGHNADEAENYLANGVNVAAVFAVKRGAPLPECAMIGATIVPVVDGDVTDLRFLDETGVIVGLRAKGNLRKVDPADNPFILA
jgi:hypothetical protein